MKLISCYIAGFGKFVNTTIDFNSDLLVIKENNGWGKTTLADFIRCMLYGLDGGRTKSVRANDRVRYEPWQGGNYGGTLTFKYGERTFRVERSFGKTPAQDFARVLDGNNALCFDFGDRAERLGEMLFGMDSDSYRRSVYIPQGEIETDGLQGDLKSRLLALLNTGGVGENAADKAIEKLDAADRALRAKRKPAKGKLDEIDERLAYISAQKAECDRCAVEAEDIRKSLVNMDREVDFFADQIRKADETLEYATRQNELAARRDNYAQTQNHIVGLQNQKQDLAVFFNGVEPTTVNLEGITTAVGEYYEKKDALTKAQAELSGLDAKYRERVDVAAKVEHLQQLVESYEDILEGDEEANRNKRGKKIVPQMNKYYVIAGLAGLVVGVVGAVLIDTMMKVGLITMGVGVLTMLVVFLLLLPRRGKKEKNKEKRKRDLRDEAIENRLRDAQAELQKYERLLATYPTDLEDCYRGLQKRIAELQEELSAREQGICNFLSNFRFEETYDYRAAVALLQNRISVYKQIETQIQEGNQRLEDLAKEMNVSAPSDAPMYASIGDLRAQKDGLTGQKEDLLSRRANAFARMERLEAQSDKAALLAEEETLTAEKIRLEKRHVAILRAKEFLLRARDSVATRYLVPVENGCKEYMGILHGDEPDNLRFTAEGEPLREEHGRLRELAYYSAGMRELLCFCIRISLVDAIFNKEKPVLILDDPFVNLDDEKTDKAKRLVKELSKRYQVLYLTCKKERKI